MGSGGVPSGGVTIVYGGVDASLSTEGIPNSITILYKNGERYQIRWYNWKGQAVRNRDLVGPKKKGVEYPHDHRWSWENGKPTRNHEHELPDYIRYPEVQK